MNIVDNDVQQHSPHDEQETIVCNPHQKWIDSIEFGIEFRRCRKLDLQVAGFAASDVWRIITHQASADDA